MRRLALTRHLEEAFPEPIGELFFRWMDEDIRSNRGYTIQLDAQGLTLGFKKHDGTAIDPTDPLVAGYWESRKQILNGDTLEAFQARNNRRERPET